jgi:hypothetical protein
MGFTIQKILRRLVPALFLCVAAAFPDPVLSLIEGRISKASKANGFYDLRLEFWERTPAAGPRLFQTIEIPHVSVKESRFEISLDAGLGSLTQANLVVKIQARAFESWKPFESAEVSRCEFGSLNSQSVSVELPKMQ